MTSDGLPPGKRSFVSFSITDFHFCKKQVLTWAASHDSKAGAGIYCFLDNHGYNAGIPSRFECLLAVGALDSLEATAAAPNSSPCDSSPADSKPGDSSPRDPSRPADALSRLKEWAASRQEWLFGHFAYDLAKETEPFHPAGPTAAVLSPATPPLHPDPIGFPDLFFFVPDILIEFQTDSIRIGSFRADHEAIWQQISATSIPRVPEPATALIPPFKARFTHDEYLARVLDLQRHIRRGDCYEINFCQEFFSQPAYPDPLSTWWSLSQASPTPFSAFYRLKERYLFCASPERYLKKTGDTLFSQPIKGTLARPQYQPLPDQPNTGQPAANQANTDQPTADQATADQATADQAAARELFHSAKDRSENVMIVDLVRNDLSRICRPGSVRVKELYGIYPFPQVFQMISTITGTLLPGMDWTDAIRATFPMGSMTGAPKNRVVQLIGQYERSPRGIFSGAVGYVTPDGDFDFNVVIRSLLYNQENHYLSYQVGSGITFYSNPQAEYEECLVKATGIMLALGISQTS
jgi:para-aminobenzoate synthetase component I